MIVDFEHGPEFVVDFSADSFDVDFGTGIPQRDYTGEYDVTPTEEEHTLPTKNKTLAENVTVGAISSEYVGSEVPRKTSADLTNTKATVNVPRGYYAENASKTLPTGSAVPAVAIIAVDSNASVQNGELVVTRTAKNKPFVTEGYIEEGTEGNTDITLKAPATNITAENIKKDINILGVTGSYETPYTWQGAHAEFVSQFYTWSGKLSDTTYASWTPSTSAGSILATVTCPTFVADMTKYEYLIEWLWYVQMAYPDGQTYKACTDRNFGTMYQVIMRRPYGLDNFASQNWAYNYCTNDYTGSGYCFYWTTGGANSWTTSQYGVYVSALTAGALSSTSSNTPTITPKRPVVSAKCHSSYFSTTRAGQVDTEKTTIKIVGNLYRMDINTSNLHYQWAKAINMYNNPL